MFPTILAAVIGALAGAFFRFEFRNGTRGWLMTVLLAAGAAALFLLMPPGQEFFGIWANVIAAAAAGALTCGVCLRQCGRRH